MNWYSAGNVSAAVINIKKEVVELNTTKSEELYKIALDLMPGGVNSPVRAFGSVGRNPLFIDHAKGAYVWDVDGNQYIDYVCSWGPGILGHAHPEVIEAVVKACYDGLTFGAPTGKGNGADGQLRHRGHHERHPCSERLYRKR